MLWRAFNPRLLRYLRARGEASFEDIAAETWTQVVTGLTRFRGDADGFRAWLFTIARNRAVDAARKSTPTARLPELADIATVESAESVVVRRLSTEHAVRMVRSLPADQAEAVALRHIADLDVATAARILGKSPAAVRVNAHRGLRTLAAQVAASTQRVPS